MTTLSGFICLIIFIVSTGDGGPMQGKYKGYGSNFPLRANDAEEFCSLEGDRLAIYDNSNREDLAAICDKISNTRQVCNLCDYYNSIIRRYF